MRLVPLFAQSLCFIAVFSALALTGSVSVHAETPQPSQQVKPLSAYDAFPHIEVVTNHGKIYLELNALRAPLTTHNFLQYVESGHYNNTVFHRVIPEFVAQGGGHDEEFRALVTRDPIVNESGNGLSNLTGTIAMARVNAPHSAAAQFYINLVDNTKLDPRADRWGYAVFGEVLYGMPLLQEVASKPTAAGGDFSKDVPVEPFIVKSMRVMASDEEIPMEPIVVAEPEDAESEDAEPENTETEKSEDTEKSQTEKAQEQVDQSKQKLRTKIPE